MLKKLISCLLVFLLACGLFGAVANAAPPTGYSIDAVPAQTSEPQEAQEAQEPPVLTTASSFTLNATEVTLYAMDSWAEAYLSIPAEKPTSFQLTVSGASNPTFRVVSGDSVCVDEQGLITPHEITWYWYGNVGYSNPVEGEEPDSITRSAQYGESVVRVSANGETADVAVTLASYAEEYAEQVMDDYLAKNLTDDMTGYEKVELACKFVAGYDYSASYSGAAGMIISGGGDCWASTDTIIRLCGKMGLHAWARNGNRDPGAGSGHMNAMVEADGKYYEAEAGYAEPAPRYYSIKERTSLYSYRSVSGGIEVYQYDGYEKLETQNVPAQIDGLTVVGIGKSFLSGDETVKTVVLPDTVRSIADSAFNSCSALERIDLPASLETLGNFVFTNCNSLKTIGCDAANPYFCAENGCVYDKEKTVLLYAPAVETLDLPESVTKLGYYALYYNEEIEEVQLPATVLELDEGCFGDCTALRRVEFLGAPERLPAYAFAECTALTSLTLPEGMREIGDGAFMRGRLRFLVLPESIETLDDAVFLSCGTLQAVFFLGDAPTVGVRVFDISSDGSVPTVYYRAGTSGWTTPTWNGCPTKTWDGTPCSLGYHAEGDWTVSRAATCTEAGEEVCTCPLCGQKETRELPALGHQWSGWVETPPTCTEYGMRTRTCARCGEEEMNYTSFALGHDYQNGVCTRCGEKDPNGQTPDDPSAQTFIDVPANAWFAGAVDYAVRNGLMNGMGNNQFQPNTSMTRGMLVTVLWRYADSPKQGRNTFSDVPSGKYYTDAVAWAAANGIVNGVGNGKFNPDGNITREQLVTILYRYCKQLNIDTSKADNLTGFPDAGTVGNSALDAMRWAVAEKLIGGKTLDASGTVYLQPKGSATRAEVATILMRFIENILK